MNVNIINMPSGYAHLEINQKKYKLMNAACGDMHKYQWIPNRINFIQIVLVCKVDSLCTYFDWVNFNINLLFIHFFFKYIQKFSQK